MTQEYAPRLPDIISAHKTRMQQPLVCREYLRKGTEAPRGAMLAPDFISSMTVGQQTTIRKREALEPNSLHLNPSSTNYLHQVLFVCKVEVIVPAALDGCEDELSQTNSVTAQQAVNADYSHRRLEGF